MLVVVMVMLGRCEGALLALSWLAFTVGLRGEFSGLLFLLGELLVLDILGCLQELVHA